MRVIEPNTIYSMDEAKRLLSPHINYETLRSHSDLITLPGGGLWGRDLIAAIDQMQERRRRKRGGASRSSDQEQDDHEKEETTNTQYHDHHGQLGSQKKQERKLEGERKSGRPRVHDKRTRQQPVANQRGKLRDLAAKAAGDGAKS